MTLASLSVVRRVEETSRLSTTQAAAQSPGLPHHVVELHHAVDKDPVSTVSSIDSLFVAVLPVAGLVAALLLLILVSLSAHGGGKATRAVLRRKLKQTELELATERAERSAFAHRRNLAIETFDSATTDEDRIAIIRCWLAWSSPPCGDREPYPPPRLLRLTS